MGTGLVCAHVVTPCFMCLAWQSPAQFPGAVSGIPVFWVFPVILMLMQHSQRNVGWEQTSWASQPGDSLEKGQAPAVLGVSPCPHSLQKGWLGGEQLSAASTRWGQPRWWGWPSSHPFPPCLKVPPVKPCGHWGIKSLPPLWLRRSRSPHCHGAGVVSASSSPAPPISLLPASSAPPKQAPGLGLLAWQSSCRYWGPSCSQAVSVLRKGFFGDRVHGNKGNGMCQHMVPSSRAQPACHRSHATLASTVALTVPAGLLAQRSEEGQKHEQMISIPLETYDQACIKDVEEGLEVKLMGGGKAGGKAPLLFLIAACMSWPFWPPSTRDCDARLFQQQFVPLHGCDSGQSCLGMHGAGAGWAVGVQNTSVTPVLDLP